MTKSKSLAIEVKGLQKVFGDNKAVDGIDLEVPSGMIYGVLGPNGAGKTTTINMLATLLGPDGGTAKIFGHDVVKEPQVVRQLIGVTGQYASVDDKLSAVENLVIFGRLLGLSRKEAKAKANELLEEFGLTEAAKRPLSKFSGGMRRRLDLAASLIAQPPLIFLDEPTTGLDPRTRNQMWDTIRRLVKSGSTILLTTQYLEEADQLADTILVIDHGRVIASGTADQLKGEVGGERLEIVVAEAAEMDTAARVLAEIGTGDPTVDQHGRRVQVVVEAGAKSLIEALRRLDVEGVTVLDVGLHRPTLDDVFLSLTGHATEDSQ